MTENHETQQARDFFNDFNKLDTPTQNKLSNAIKSLAFLYSMADTQNDTNTTFEKTITAIEA